MLPLGFVKQVQSLPPNDFLYQRRIAIAMPRGDDFHSCLSADLIRFPIGEEVGSFVKITSMSLSLRYEAVPQFILN